MDVCYGESDEMVMIVMIIILRLFVRRLCVCAFNYFKNDFFFRWVIIILMLRIFVGIVDDVVILCVV